MLISFDDVVTLSPDSTMKNVSVSSSLREFNSLRAVWIGVYLNRAMRLFTLFGETGLAFRVNEVTWLLGLSNQWVFKQIKEGTVPVFLGRREHRKHDENLILAQDLRKLKSEPVNIKERLFELFTLK